MNIKRYTSAIVALTTLATLAAAFPALADNTASTTQPVKGAWNGHEINHGNRANMKPGVFGTVSAVNGNIITVTSKKGFGPKAEGTTTTNTTVASTTFTVDATNAKITKDNTAGTISSIVVGDTVMAQGTLTGTNLVATTIRDEIMKGGEVNKPNQVPAVTNNGEPMVAGTVSAVSGSTITITNKSSTAYTIDATNAKIMRDSKTVTVSDVVVGDIVLVQGTISGNAVVASTIIDQAKPANTGTIATGTNQTQPHKGFFGAIGSFFSHIFGF